MSDTTHLLSMIERITSAFIILLSTKKGFTFSVSDDFFNAFPFEDWHLVSERNEKTGETIFSLQNVTDKVH